MFVPPMLSIGLGVSTLCWLWPYTCKVYKTRKLFSMLYPPAKLSYINSEGDEIELEVNVLDYDFDRLTSKFEVIRPSKGPEYLFEHFRAHPEMYANPESESLEK